MKRLFVFAVSALLLGLVAGACDDEPRRFDMGYGPTTRNPQCGQYAACGTCTPALGCGWCFTGGTTGLCVDDPGNCPEATTIGWTWESVGCRTPTGDASVFADASIRSDAGTTPDDASVSPADAKSDVY